jgi:hypothetical protein
MLGEQAALELDRDAVLLPEGQRRVEALLALTGQQRLQADEREIALHSAPGNLCGRPRAGGVGGSNFRDRAGFAGVRPRRVAAGRGNRPGGQ